MIHWWMFCLPHSKKIESYQSTNCCWLVSLILWKSLYQSLILWSSADLQHFTTSYRRITRWRKSYLQPIKNDQHYWNSKEKLISHSIRSKSSSYFFIHLCIRDLVIPIGSCTASFLRCRYYQSIMPIHWLATYLDPSFRELAFVTDRQIRCKQQKMIQEGLLTMSEDIDMDIAMNRTVSFHACNSSKQYFD